MAPVLSGKDFGNGIISVIECLRVRPVNQARWFTDIESVALKNPQSYFVTSVIVPLNTALALIQLGGIRVYLFGKSPILPKIRAR